MGNSWNVQRLSPLFWNFISIPIKFVETRMLLIFLSFICIISKFLIINLLVFPCCNTDIYSSALPDTSYTILFHVINWCTHPLLLSGEFKRVFLNFTWDCYFVCLSLWDIFFSICDEEMVGKERRSSSGNVVYVSDFATIYSSIISVKDGIICSTLEACLSHLPL